MFVATNSQLLDWREDVWRRRNRYCAGSGGWYLELRREQELAVKKFAMGNDVFVSLPTGSENLSVMAFFQ